MKIGDRIGGRRGRDEEDGRGQAGRAVADDLFEKVFVDVVDRLDTRGAKQFDAAELVAKLEEIVHDVLEERQISISSRRQKRLVAALSDEILGLGPMETLLADPSVSDILVNNSKQVYVERNGLLEPTEVHFRDDDHLLNTINRIVAKVGRRIDEASPMVDARLPDGSRVNAIIPPLAIDGPVLSIRRFGGGPVSIRELAEKGALTRSMAHYFRSAVRSRANILVCGGTGAGKTTMLNALSGFISSRERIITVEDSAELKLQQKHVVRLETRPANIEGSGEVSIRDLVRNALRMRPDRIIVGEVRAQEVLDMVQAMNTGHDGSMTTIHANGVSDAFTRLMSMLSMSGTQLSEGLMLQMIARALDVIVHLTRAADGRRCVNDVAEVGDVIDGEVQVNTVFSLDRKRAEGEALRWGCSGHSELLDRFRAAGVPLDERALAPS